MSNDVRFQMVDCRSETPLTDEQVEKGTTLSQFLADKFEGEADDFFDELLVKVNRMRVDVSNYELHNGDQIVLSPRNVSGAL